MLKEKLGKAAKKVGNIVKRTPAASAMMAVAMGATALTSCSWERGRDSSGRWYEHQSLDIRSVFGGNGNGYFGINDGGYDGYWGGTPMYSDPRWHRSGMAPGDRYLGRNSAGQGVIRVAQPSLDMKDLVTKKDADGIEWQVAKGTKLPKSFKVIITKDNKTIPVPAAQYEQITKALEKGVLTFAVDANGHYGLVSKEAAKEIKSGNLTLEQLANLSNPKATSPKVTSSNSR